MQRFPFMSLLGNFNTQFSNIQRKSALASLGSVRTSHVTFFFWQKSRFLFFAGEIGIVTCKKNGTKGTKGSWSWTSNWRPFTAGNPCSEEQDWEQCLALSTTWGENSVLGERMTNGDGGICISSLAVPTNTLHQSPQILCISSSPHKYSVPARM